MKILTIVLVLAIAVGIVANYFSQELLRIKDALLRPSDSKSNASQPPRTAHSQTQQPTSSNPKWVPEGFRGPTREPRIIGPRGNPPNY